MKLFYLAFIAVFLIKHGNTAVNHDYNKVVCFWNSTSFQRSGPGQVKLEDLTPALGYCTHLIYGFAGIDASTFSAVSLNPALDTGAGHAFFRLVPQFKQNFPDLKVLLSIGGNADPYEDTHKYLTLTETTDARSKFIDSVVRLLGEYDFDGVDLAWQFPPVKPKSTSGAFTRFWHGVKKVFGYGKFKDDKEEEHRSGFTTLVRDLKTQIRSRNKLLTLSVLPHVNSSVYYEPRLLTPNIDAVHLLAFDQLTPERNPKEADFAAPLYESYGRVPEDNVDSTTRFWLENGTPGSKIVIGIPTFARTWKLTSDSQISGVPPIVTDGPGLQGPLTETPGVLSYGEVCARLTESAVGRVRLVKDPSKKYGSYAYQSYNQDTGADGIWISHEDIDTAGNKASYARAKGLGGVAIWDLSTDDYRGTCNNEKFPIVKAVKLQFATSRT